MRTPKPRLKDKSMEDFASVHESMRKMSRSGTVEPGGGGPDGGAVFLNGTVVYARYGGKTAEEALKSLISEGGNGVRASLSDSERVMMFRTYLRYISDDGLITAEPLDDSAVEPHDVEGVIINGIRNARKGTWRGQTNDIDRSFFPEGRRSTLAPDFASLRRYIDEQDVSGYAVGTHEVVTFRDGEVIDRKEVAVESSVRKEVSAADGWVIVDTNVDVDVDDTGREKKDESLLSRLL